VKPEINQNKSLWPLIVLTALILVLLAQPALGVPTTKQWVGTPFNNLWTTASNWSPAGEPGTGDDVFVTQSGFFPETVIYNTLANPTLYSLTIDATGWGKITLQQSGNALTADIETVGLDGKGVYDQSGGSNTVNTFLYLGYNPTGKGTYNLSGSGSLSADHEIIGLYGNGVFIQSGGTHTIATLEIAPGVTPSGSTLYFSKGTYNLTGGSLSVSNEEVIGVIGTGVFTQSGGTNMTPYLKLGESSVSFGSTSYQGNGTYNLSCGSLSVSGDEVIGSYGIGNLNQTGGSNMVAGTLTLGDQSQGSGSYHLKGGSLSVDGFEYVGNSGIGTFTQIGGSHTVKNGLNLGEQSTGNGAYHLYGGSLQVNGTELLGFLGTGLFDQWGGQHTVTGFFALGLASNSSGAYHLKGGSLQVGGNEVIGLGSTGSFIQSGGRHTIASAPGLLLGANGGSSGTYNLKFGTLAVGTDEIVGNEGTGTFIQAGGSQTVAHDLFLGGSTQVLHGAGSGTYHLKGGTLAVGNDEFIGYQGTGIFDQRGGKHTVAGNLNLGLTGGSSGTFNLKGGNLKIDGSEFLGVLGIGIVNQSGGKHTVGGTLNVGAGGTGIYNLSGGKLTAGAINITTNSGTFNVLNTITTVTGNVEVNDGGTVRTTKALVTWNGNFTIGILSGDGAYISDHAKQIFKGDLEVGPFGFIQTTDHWDQFIIKENFFNYSQNTDWDTAAATLKFATGAGWDTDHDFYIPGADTGPPGDVLVTALTDNFAWGILNIFGQTVHLFDGNTGNIGTAQYVGGLIGAKVNWFTKMVYNLINDDSSEINIYYDPDLWVNFYLHGQTYDLAGTGGGQLIPYHTPLPPSVLLLGSGLLGLGLLGWRRKRLMG
jgi:hypothetical protein